MPSRRIENKKKRIPEAYIVLGILLVAFAIRLVYLTELKSTPFFHYPVGDSKIYHERALDIARGDLIGHEAYFHSSPFYSYFLAVIYKLTGPNLTVVRVIQLLIGSLTCGLIYLLTRKISPKRRGPPMAAPSWSRPVVRRLRTARWRRSAPRARAGIRQR